MSIEQGAGLALDKLLKVGTEKQIMGTPEAEQFEKKPIILKTPPKTEQPSAFPQEEQFPQDFPLTNPETGEELIAKLAENGNVWYEGQKVGVFDFNTGEYTPVKQQTSPLQKIGGAYEESYQKPTAAILTSPAWFWSKSEEEKERIRTASAEEWVSKFGTEPPSNPIELIQMLDFARRGAFQKEAVLRKEYEKLPEAAKIGAEIAADMPLILAGGAGATAAKAAITGASKGAKVARVALTVAGAGKKPTPKSVKPKIPTPKAPKIIPKAVAEQNIIDTETALEKMRVLFKERKPARAAIETIKKEVRGERARKLEEIAQTAKTPEEFLRRSGKALTGKFAFPPIYEALPEGAFTTRERLLILNYITNHPLFYEHPHDLFRMGQLLFNKIIKGGVPTKGEFKSLEQVFGWDMAEAIAKHGTLAKAWRVFMGVSGLPKSLKATADVSYTLRQTIFAGVANPKLWGRNFVKQLKAFKSQTFFDDAMREIQAHPEFEHARKIGRMDFTQVGAKIQRGMVEEAYPTSLADLIPVMKQSNRAATYMSNAMRFDTYYKYREMYGALNYPDHVWEELGKILMAGTGRGVVPKNLVPAFTALNRVFFSPRFALTPAQMIYFPLRYVKNPLVRRFALRSWFGFVGLNTSILGLGKATGLWDVELNPTSSNFGRARVGDVRFDLWHGYLPWVRLMARLVTKTSKTETGEIADINRADMTVHTIRGKLDPVTAAVWDLMEGKSYIGEEFPPKEEDVPRALQDRLLPMAVMDIWDAYASDAITGATIAGGAAILGGNVAAYPSRTFDQWADWVAEETGKEWTYGELQAIRPDLSEAEGAWTEYFELPRGESREYYLKDKPELEAQLYFWGKIGRIKNEDSWDTVKEMLENYDLPETVLPIGTVEDPWEAEGKAPEEVWNDLLQMTPKYLSDYLHEHRAEWEKKDLATIIPAIEETKKSDKALIAKYDRLPNDSKLRIAYRKDNPDVDVALYLWGNVSTLQSDSARSKLIAKAKELGIPPEAFPILSKKSKGGIPRVL